MLGGGGGLLLKRADAYAPFNLNVISELSQKSFVIFGGYRLADPIFGQYLLPKQLELQH